MSLFATKHKRFSLTTLQQLFFTKLPIYFIREVASVDSCHTLIRSLSAAFTASVIYRVATIERKNINIIRASPASQSMQRALSRNIRAIVGDNPRNRVKK